MPALSQGSLSPSNWPRTTGAKVEDLLLKLGLVFLDLLAGELLELGVDVDLDELVVDVLATVEGVVQVLASLQDRAQLVSGFHL